MTDVPASSASNELGAFGYYTATALQYFYITFHFNENPNSKWGLIRVRQNGEFEFCGSISHRVADVDDHGKLKVVGVDLIE